VNLNQLIFLVRLLFRTHIILILMCRTECGYPAFVGRFLKIGQLNRGILIILLAFGLAILNYCHCLRYLE
jgi:hypothetical protein